MFTKNCLPLLLAFVLITFSACRKKGNNGDNPPPAVQEEALKFELPEILVGKPNVALDSTYTFKVKITSKFPEKGVKISLNVVSDPAGIPLQQSDIPDAATGDFTITLLHLKELKTYRVTITLTSKGNTANVSVPLDFLITNKAAG